MVSGVGFWRVNQCLDSAVGASAVKLVNPVERGLALQEGTGSAWGL